ncbi:MAG: leucine-rich repeat protein, partial [Clostridia bacterium]|nr:leucine-rich repeat protein [Clostridia bacterium]
TCTEQARCEDCGGAYGALLEHTYEGEENGGACIYCHTTYLEETVEFHLSEDGRSYVLFAAQNYKQESIVIPAEYEGLAVTQIGEWSFAYNKYVKSVYLPNTIKIIGEGAFDTSALQSIVCPDSLEVIGGEAFCGSQLETINLHTGIREIGGDAFVRTNIKSIVFPWSVEILEKNLFRGCNQLEQVIVQDGIRYIGTWAFADCPRLKTVVFPNTLEGTGGELFKESPAIEYNTYGGLRYIGTATNPFFAVVGSTGATNAVIHPDTELCTIKALLDCEEIVSLEIGAKVRTIEEWALIGMDALESITVDPQNSNYYVINNLLVDARTNTLIAGCKTSVIPDDGRFAEIDLGLFSGIQTMTEIWIPEGVKTIHIACGGMNSLEKIIIGPDVEHIIVHGNNDGCFETNSACFGVYYCFTEEEWKNVNVEYTFNRKAFMRPTDCYGDHATHYFYSETPPQGEGNYWHYVDGVPTPW